MAQKTTSAMTMRRTSPNIQSSQGHKGHRGAGVVCRFCHLDREIRKRLPTPDSSSMEIIVRVIEPILPNRAEHIELEGVLEGFSLMLDPRRDVQHFAFPDGHLFTADEKLQRALQDVRHLLALVRMHRYEAAALQVDLREHFPSAGDEFARQHFRDFFERNFVPSMQPHGL